MLSIGGIVFGIIVGYLAWHAILPGKRGTIVNLKTVTNKYFALLVMATVILIAIVGCNNVNTLTPEKIIDQQDRWLNKSITVQGTVGTLWMSCTAEGCDPDNPCCNGCFGSLALYTDADSFSETQRHGPYAYESNGPAIGLEFPNGDGCKGNECEISCEPLQLGERYIVTGVLRECYGFVPYCVMKVESYEHE